MKSKRGLFWENIIPWMIAFAVLVFGIITYVVINGKGDEALEFLKGILT